MGGCRYRLYLEDGDDIGTFATAVPDCDIGMELITSDQSPEILDIVSAVGDGEFAGAFVVVPVELAEP